MKLLPLCNNPLIKGFVEHVRSNKKSKSITDFSAMFLLDLTKDEDMVKIAKEFKVKQKWDTKVKQLNQDEADIPAKYFNLLWLCKTEGECPFDLNFIEGRHRIVAVIYFMCAASYNNTDNFIRPNSIVQTDILNFGLGDKNEDINILLDDVISNVLTEGTARLVSKAVNVKIISAKNNDKKENNVDAKEIVQLCKLLSELVSKKKRDSSKQTLGFKLVQAAMQIFERAKLATIYNEKENKTATFEALTQPETTKKINKEKQTVQIHLQK